MPQNQKTKPREQDEELPPLNAQEEKLVEAVLQGMNNSDAYRTAYGASGYSAPALYVKACRKVGSSKIQAHLRAIRAVGVAKIGLSVQDRIEAEAAFAQRAEDAGNFGAAGGAHDRINKLAGLYVEQIRDVTERHDPRATVKELAEITGADPNVIAAKYGVDLGTDVEGATKH